METDWVSRVPSIVFSRIKNEFSKEIKEKYSMTDKNFSTVGSSDTPAVFPFVYVKLLPAVEMGMDLDGKSINAGLFTFQIDVTDNKSQSRAKSVSFEILRIMKNMRFEVTAMPDFEDTKDTHRSTMRFRRVIGDGDVL